MKSIKDLKVSDLINNLNTANITHADKLSNSQKSAERVEWFTLAINENRLTNFLSTIENTINALPEGTDEVATVNPITGAKGTKKVNQRDIAKNSYKTAWNHACKGTDFSDKILKFKLSMPQLDDRKAPPSFEDKIAKLLGDSVDKSGLTNILTAVNKAQESHKAEVTKLAEAHASMQLRSNVLSDIAYAMRKDGMTIERAQSIAAGMNNISQDKLLEAIG